LQNAFSLPFQNQPKFNRKAREDLSNDRKRNYNFLNSLILRQAAHYYKRSISAISRILIAKYAKILAKYAKQSINFLSNLIFRQAAYAIYKRTIPIYSPEYFYKIHLQLFTY